MPEQEQPEAETAPETAWQRKRRLARIFGDALPETTSDERDDKPTADTSDTAGDAWLKSQVPPHHGG